MNPVPVPANFRSETVVVNGVRLHYWLGGNPHGKPVLLWHGFLGTDYIWHKVMPLMAEAGYSVLVPDMRGYGDSDKPAGTDGYDARALAEEFRVLCRQIGFGVDQKLLIAAHDMGAHPALLWAADHPEEVAGLAYMDVPTAADPGSISEDEIAETLRTFSGTEGVLGSLGVYRAAFKTIEQTTPLKRKKVEVPILAVGGEKGLSEKVGTMVEAVAKHVTSQVIKNCGHFICLRATSRVRTSLSGLRGTGHLINGCHFEA